MRRVLIFGFILSILFCATAYADSTYGVVIGSRVNVRASAEIADNLLFQVDRGTLVEIHGVSGDFFCATISGNGDVFIAREFVRVTQTFGTVSAPFAWFFDLPEEEGGTAINMLFSGNNVTINSVFGEWFGIEINNSVAFVEQSAIVVPFSVELPAARIGNSFADEIIETAMNYLGTRYLWGGNSPSGFDCSDFVNYVFSRHGIELNRSSRDQARNGVFVARDELERGDLVFFGSGKYINHAGLYIGDGKFIHSSSDSSGGVIISSMYEKHNARGFVTARRVL